MKTITEFLSTKITKPSIIKATDETIHQIVKDELDRLGHDADLNHIDVSKVTNMKDLFSCDSSDLLGPKYKDLNLDISKWNVSNVENMYNMFLKCENFDQDLSEWDVSNVRNMDYMFANCRCFNQDLSKWDVHKVETMRNMFRECKEFNQNIANWDVSNVKNNFHMFIWCPIEEKYKPKFNICDEY